MVPTSIVALAIAVLLLATSSAGSTAGSFATQRYSSMRMQANVRSYYGYANWFTNDYSMGTLSKVVNNATHAFAINTDSGGGSYIWAKRTVRTDSGAIIDGGKLTELTILAGGDFMHQGGGYSGDGGPAARAQLNDARTLAVSSRGHLYIADSGNCRVRRINLVSGTIVTVVGNGECASEAPSNSCDTGACDACKVAIGAVTDLSINEETSSLFIADPDNRRVRRFNIANGKLTTLAGPGGDPSTATAETNGDGAAATAATLIKPTSVVVSYRDPLAPGGLGPAVWILDSVAGVVRKVGRDGVITTVAGVWNTMADAPQIYRSAPVANAKFYYPTQIAVDPVLGRTVWILTYSGLVHALRWSATGSGTIATIAKTAGLGAGPGSREADPGVPISVLAPGASVNGYYNGAIQMSVRSDQAIGGTGACTMWLTAAGWGQGQQEWLAYVVSVNSLGSLPLLP